MFGQWLSNSGTRKLNRHYQGVFTGPPLEYWLGLIVAGFGANMLYSGTLSGLTFRNDGCYVGNARYGGSLVIPSRPIGQSTFTSFVPFMIMDVSEATLNGYQVPDLMQYTLTDSTGKLKLIKTNVTFYWIDTLNVEQHITRNCYVFGYLPSDMPTTQSGFGNVQISDAKFADLKWRLPKGSPVLFKVQSTEFFTDWQDYAGNAYISKTALQFERELVDESGPNGINAPSIGSGMSFDDTLELNYGHSGYNFYCPSLGCCRFGYIDQSNYANIESVFQAIGYNGDAELDYGYIAGYPTTSTKNIKCVASEFSCDYGFLQIPTDNVVVDMVEHDINSAQVVNIY